MRKFNIQLTYSLVVSKYRERKSKSKGGEEEGGGRGEKGRG